MLRMPAKRVAPRPKVEGEGDWNDVLCQRLDPIKVCQLILDPEVIVFNIITLIILIIEIIFIIAIRDVLCFRLLISPFSILRSCF